MTTNIIANDDFVGETDNETEEDPLIPDDLNLKVNTKKIKWTHKNINHDFINDFHPVSFYYDYY